MSKQQETLRLALEALETSLYPQQKQLQAITAIKEALAQPEQEPSELDIWKSRALQAEAVVEKFMAQPEQHQDWCASLTQMLASMPPKQAPCNCKPAQPEQELVVWGYARKIKGGGWALCHKRNYEEAIAYGDNAAVLYTPQAQPEQEHVATSDTSEKRVDEMAKQLHEPEQEPQYAGTARELFTNAAIERLDVRPSTKVYLGTPSVCEQPAHQEPVWDASAPMVVHPHPAFQATPPQSEPVIDKSAAIRIATSLGWTPQRTWVGLTDEEQQELYNAWMQKGDGWGSFYTLIEAKLRSKNT